MINDIFRIAIVDCVKYFLSLFITSYLISTLIFSKCQKNPAAGMFTLLASMACVTF